MTSNCTGSEGNPETELLRTAQDCQRKLYRTVIVRPRLGGENKGGGTFPKKHLCTGR